MQTKPHQLRRQQQVLKHLGYYSGKIDGIWGPATIEAKRNFESDKKFKPSYPNGGLPFAETHDLPAGIEWQFSPTGPLLTVKGMALTEQIEVQKEVPKSQTKILMKKQPGKETEKVDIDAPLNIIEVSNLGSIP